MIRTLALTFEFEATEFRDVDGEICPPDPLGEAMDMVNAYKRCGGIFVEARLDGELLIDKDGNAADEVKKLVQYELFMREQEKEIRFMAQAKMSKAIL